MGNWCAGCRHHRPHPGRPERVHGQPLGVERQRYGGDARRRVQGAVPGTPGVLDTDGVRPARVQREPEQSRRLGHPGDDDEALRVGDHAPAAGEERGERGAQPGQPARVGIAEFVVRQLGEHTPLRGGPGGAREQRQVRGARHEVGPYARGPRSEVTRAWPGRPDGAAHPGSRAAAAAQIALGRQLLVRLRHQPARDAEIGGQIPARRQPGVLRETPRADRVPQGGLERAATRARRGRGGRQQQLPGGRPGTRAGIGPRWRHGSGP